MARPFSIDRYLNIRAANAPSFSPDGRFITFLTNTTGLQRGPGGYYLAAGWSSDDRSLLVYHMETNFQQNLYVLDIHNGKAHHLTPHRGDAQYHSPYWSADGQKIYCASTADGRDLAG